MAVPQTRKKVGPFGCILSLLILVLGVGAAIVLFVVGVVGAVNKISDSPSVSVGSSQRVTVSSGAHELYFADLNDSGSLPFNDPDVTITDPGGDAVVISSAPSSDTSPTSGNSFRTIGVFNASTSGQYDVKVNSVVGGTGSKVYIGPPFNDLFGSLVGFLVGSIALGSISFIVALILGVVWLVRRSRAKRPVYPAYQGGPYGGPPGGYGGPPAPGPPGGYGGPPAPGPPGGYTGPPAPGPPAPGPPGGYGGPPAPGPPAPGPPPGTPGSF
jgi:hypothetical protein